MGNLHKNISTKIMFVPKFILTKIQDVKVKNININ